MASCQIYRVGKKGATVRLGVSLNSEKLGRLRSKTVVSVDRVARTMDGVERGQVCFGERVGWVSLWVLTREGEEKEEREPAGPWIEGPVVSTNPQVGTGLDVECDGFRFRSDFCSGNLRAVRLGSDGKSFEVRAGRDCEGTPWESRHSAWFFFRMEGSGSRRVVCESPSKQGALYRYGYRPVFRHLGEMWKRLPSDTFSYREVVETKKKKACVTELSWTFDFVSGLAVEFAFCYPYSLDENLNGMLASLENKSFCKRELLATSLDGRPIELLTVSEGVSRTREKPLEVYQQTSAATTTTANGGVAWTIVDDDGSAGDTSDEGDEGGPADDDSERPTRKCRLTPHRTTQDEDLIQRREIIVSARVHPGETPSSFAMEGLVRFLTREDDHVAAALRKAYVWRLIPVLNPDGVSRGHFRRDARGDDLNRHYWPRIDADAHPAQASLVSLVARASQNNALAAVIDLHAHATKRGCFLFGNYGRNSVKGRAQARLFPALLAARSTHFEFDGCDFSRRKESGVPGSARVACRRYGFCDSWTEEDDDDDNRRWGPHAYTVECNYNQGHVVDLAYSDSHPPHSIRVAKALDGHQTTLTSPYTPDAWRDVGRAIGLAMLDLTPADMRPKSLEWDNSLRDDIYLWLSVERLLATPPPPQQKSTTTTNTKQKRRPSSQKKSSASSKPPPPPSEKGDASSPSLSVNGETLKEVLELI